MREEGEAIALKNLSNEMKMRLQCNEIHPIEAFDNYTIIYINSHQVLIS